MKKIEFTKDHIGLEVTDRDRGKGKIVNFFATLDGFPLRVKFEDGRFLDFHSDGSRGEYGGQRQLFIGHNVELNVKEDELPPLPPPKLICPVCGVEHELICGGPKTLFRYDTPDACPFSHARFFSKDASKEAMKRLITALPNKPWIAEIMRDNRITKPIIIKDEDC